MGRSAHRPEMREDVRARAMIFIVSPEEIRTYVEEYAFV
jgi:hypothetical protein